MPALALVGHGLDAAAVLHLRFARHQQRKYFEVCDRLICATLEEVGVHVSAWCVRLDLPQFLILIPDVEIRMQIPACGYDCFGDDSATVCMTVLRLPLL